MEHRTQKQVPTLRPSDQYPPQSLLAAGIARLLHAMGLRRVVPKIHHKVKPVGIAGGTHKSPEENFKNMRLLSHTHVVDQAGIWWSVETRQCRYTGLILRQTTRISE